jgi:transcriptional regulator with XRE-family HTH domain
MDKPKEVLAVNLARLRGNESQKAIAEKAGLSLRQYSRYEHGLSWPGEETLESLAAVYGIPVDELVRNQHNRIANRTTQNLTLLNTLAPTLSEDDLQTVVNLARRLAGK